jgi:hypothetical protein
MEPLLIHRHSFVLDSFLRSFLLLSLSFWHALFLMFAYFFLFRLWIN